MTEEYLGITNSLTNIPINSLYECGKYTQICGYFAMCSSLEGGIVYITNYAIWSKYFFNSVSVYGC